MSTTAPIKERIKTLKAKYDQLRIGKGSLLTVLDESELPESVFNSNAIENSTLTLKETEKILLDMEVSRNVSVREVFEAKNLARVIEYVRQKAPQQELSIDTILLLHTMLIGNISEELAGRFRVAGEYVRVGTHIGSPPEKIGQEMRQVLSEFTSDHDRYIADKIALFHLDFETTHPFNDGNGRIGRVVINYQLQSYGFPNIIIRDREKKTYYGAFTLYPEKKQTKPMETIITQSMMESLHKRIAYLRGDTIIPLAEYAKVHSKSLRALLNAASRQTIPAFREKNIWKISKNYF